MRQNQLGNSGTYFWFGVVEDRFDPEKVGRVRVRVYGDHTDDRAKLPIEHLPWAQCTIPCNANEGETTDLKEGTTVFGIYLDGEEKQNPFVMGVVPGIVWKQGGHQQGFNDPRPQVTSSHPGKPILGGENIKEPPVREQVPSGTPTVSSYARNAGTRLANTIKNGLRKIGVKIAGGGTFDEPADPYSASYPYNNARETESGHVMEFDDTPGKERIHIFHRSGSYIEIHPDGTIVRKSSLNEYDFIAKDNFVSISGHKIEVVENGSSLRIDSGYDIEVTSKDLNIKVLSGDANIEVSGNTSISTEGTLDITVGDKLNINANEISIRANDTYTMTAGGTLLVDGSPTVIVP